MNQSNFIFRVIVLQSLVSLCVCSIIHAQFTGGSGRGEAMEYYQYTGIPASDELDMEVIWERNQRTDALANVPSWLTAANERGIAIGTHEGQTRLYVASRTGGNFIRVLDAYTGADIDAATSAFDLATVSGGTFPINDIGITSDGKLVVANLAVGTNTNPFKVYIFEQSGGAPIASYTYTTAESRRLGDKISVFGSWTAGTLEVWSVHAANPGEVHKVKTADQGQNWTTEVVTLSAPTPANQTTVGNSSVTRAPNGDMFINGNGSLVKRFTATGEYIANQNVGTVGSMSGVRYFEAGGTPYIAVYAYRELPAGTDPVLGYTKFFDITDPEAPVKVAASPKLASAASGNAISGDVEVLVNEDGSYIVYALGATQGLIAFGTLPELIDETTTILLAWETQGLSGTTAAPFNATTVAENVAPSGLVRGSALTATGLTNGFASSGFNHVDYDAAVTAGSYLGFTVQAEPGYQVSLSSIAYNFRRSGTGPNKFQWAYSVDGGDTFVKFGDEIEYTSTETNGIPFGPHDIGTIEDLQDVTSAATVHLRLYGYGATQSGGTGAIGRLEGNDLVVKGHVEVDPDYIPATPPSDYIALALGIHEVPVRMTTGAGSFNASLSDDQLVLTGAFSDLVGTYTMSHIHVGAVSTNGGVVFTLNADVDTDGKGGTYTAENNTFTLSAEQIVALAAGNYYINIHSTEYTGGEIRGQLLAAPNAAPTASLVTAPVDGSEIVLEGISAQTVNVVWTAATDPDDDTVAYIFQLSADTDFTQVVLNVNAGTGTTAALTFGEINALLADNGVNVGQTITLHHRVVSSDGSNVTAGPSNAITIERGEIKAVYTIAEARALPNNTTPIVVEGIVTRAFGREARIQDATGAMGTFQSAGDYFEAIASGAVAQGDLVRITGRRAEFGSLVQVDNITAFEVISRNNALPTPVTVTLAQIRDNGADYESKLVRVEGITINADGDATFSAGTGSGKTYQISDATVSSGEVFFRVPNQLNTTIVGTPIPSVPFIFEGVLGRFNADWQLYAVRGSDVFEQNPPLFFDDFSTDLSRWVSFAGQWSVQNNELVGNYGLSCGAPGCPQAHLLPLDEYQPTGPYRVSVDFIRTRDQTSVTYFTGMASFIWVQDEQTRTSISLGNGGTNWPSTSELESIDLNIQHWSNNQWTYINTQEFNVTWDPFEWNTFSMVHIGRDISIYLNEQYLGSYSNDLFFEDGKTGLHTYGTRRFDNFKIEAIPSICVWPGDTNNDGIVNSADILPIGLFYGQTTNSNLIEGAEWRCYSRDVWPLDGGSPRRLFADANGDGVIDLLDLETLSTNYASRRNEKPFFQMQKKPELLVPDSLVLDVRMQGNQLSFSTNGEVDLYGLYIRLSFDSNQLKPGFDKKQTVITPILMVDNWNPKTRRYDLGFSRFNFENQSVSGEVFAIDVAFLKDIDAYEGIRIVDEGSYFTTVEGGRRPLVLNIKPEITSVDDFEKDLPQEVALLPNFPNPFNPSTQIVYAIPDLMDVKLAVFDVTGRLVATLHNGIATPGVHTLPFDAARLSSGVYIVYLNAAGQVHTRKILLLK